MGKCSGTTQSHGTGQSKNGMTAALKALKHFMLNGHAACVINTCDSGGCTFGISAAQYNALEWGDPQMVGEEVRLVSVVKEVVTVHKHLAILSGSSLRLISPILITVLKRILVYKVNPLSSII